jgi:hypothetical protein
MVDDDKTGPGTEQRKCTLSTATIRYLELLAARGTHGSRVSGVMTTLIEQGIRNAIEKGYIKLD